MTEMDIPISAFPASLAILFLSCSHSSAITVSNTGDSGNGSLREAIAIAPPGGTIDFEASLSGQTIRLTSGELSIGKDLRIDGSALPDPIIISGDADASGTPSAGDSRVFKILLGGHQVEFDGLVITGGKAPATVFDEVGGGIFNDEGNLTLINCTVEGNTADDSPLSIASGGGIYSQLGRITMVGTTVSGNRSLFGGGIAQFENSLELVNSTISGNLAIGKNAGDGGGIYNLSGTVSIVSSTISDNVADFGGGLFNGDPSNPASVTNSIIAGNSAVVSNDNIRGEFSANGSITSGDPMLCALGDYGGSTATMPPKSGSPAINSAVGAVAATDQRGIPRPQGCGPDAGAVEVADGGFGPLSIEVTYFDFDAMSGEVVLRWKNVWGDYMVQSSSDLLFGEAGDALIPVDSGNGIVDTETWPGEIQFTFVDPNAGGGPGHFWRVTGL